MDTGQSQNSAAARPLLVTSEELRTAVLPLEPQVQVSGATSVAASGTALSVVTASSQVPAMVTGATVALETSTVSAMATSVENWITPTGTVLPAR
ncbi:hypothetical protein OS493_020837 [Desmophyllum pertusum]|uniref:Uncharacterized protein n=1 Tax=Desmophyllum pertusum TaxID=174260 RepID=A0A9X0CDW3_9CNID|nr:hypothetical protein OS493_020837 [Desmophyllum pertusum]